MSNSNNSLAAVALTPSRTTTVASGSMLTLTEASDRDWFDLGIVQPGQTVQVDISLLNSEGDIDLEILNRNNLASLDYSGWASDTESVTWTNETPSPVPVVAEAFWYFPSQTCAQDYLFEYSVN